MTSNAYCYIFPPERIGSGNSNDKLNTYRIKNGNYVTKFMHAIRKKIFSVGSGLEEKAILAEMP